MSCGCGCKPVKSCYRTNIAYDPPKFKGAKCCDKKKLGCPSKCGKYRSRYSTETAERIALRRDKNLCCPIEPVFTKCKGVTCPKVKPIGKIKCNVKDNVLDLECGECQPCKKNNCGCA